MTGKSIETYLNKLNERCSYLEKEMQRIKNDYKNRADELITDSIVVNYYYDLTQEKLLLTNLFDFYNEKGTFF